VNHQGLSVERMLVEFGPLRAGKSILRDGRVHLKGCHEQKGKANLLKKKEVAAKKKSDLSKSKSPWGSATKESVVRGVRGGQEMLLATMTKVSTHTTARTYAAVGEERTSSEWRTKLPLREGFWGSNRKGHNHRVGGKDDLPEKKGRGT